MILVGVDGLGHGRIDFDFDRAVGPNSYLLIGHQFRRLIAAWPPERHWPHAAPVFPTGIPMVIVSVPPIAGPIEPVPWPNGIPTLVVVAAVDLILHFGLRDRRAEIILRLDRGRDRFAEHHRYGRRVDRDFVLRLLVFLDAETAAAHVLNVQRVNAQRSIGGHRIFTLDTAVGIGFFTFLDDSLALGIVNFYREIAVGKLRTVFHIVFGVPNPEFVFHLLVGPIDGPVGDRENLRGFVLGVVPVAIPNAGETEIRESARVGPCGDEPLIIRNLLSRIGDDLTVGVGKLGKLLGKNFVSRRLIVILLLPAEELHVGFGHGLARHRVGHIVIRLAGKRLLDNRRVIDPNDDHRRVAVGHFGVYEIRTGLLQGRGNGHSLVEVFFARLQRQLPLGRLSAEILLLVLLDQTVADVGNVDFLPIEVLGIRFKELFHVVEQFFDLNFMGRKLDLTPVAETVLKGRALAGRLRLEGLKSAPIAHDLVEPLLPILAAVKLKYAGIFLKELTPIVGRLGILATILEDLGQMFQRIGSTTRLRLGGNFLINFDVVELVRQFEPLNARGQPSNGLVFLQRMQSVGATLVFLRIVRFHPAETPAPLGHGLHAKLVLQKIGELHPHLAQQLRIQLDRLLQTPPPALAVGLGSLERLRHIMEHRLSVGINRSARGLALVAPALIVVGQYLQVGQILQSPRLAVAAVVQQHAGQRLQEIAYLGMVFIFLGQRHRLGHQLQSADAVALDGIDHPTSAAFVATNKFARHDEPMMWNLHVLLRGGMQQTPIFLVDLNRLFQQGVDLFNLVEPLKALNRHRQIAAYLPGIVLWIKHQLVVSLIRILDIALLEGFSHVFAEIGGQRGVGGDHRERENRGCYHTDGGREVESRTVFHRKLS